MIRAKAIDKDTVHVEIISHDFRVIRHEKAALKGAIPARDRYWDRQQRVWVVMHPTLWNGPCMAQSNPIGF